MSADQWGVAYGYRAGNGAWIDAPQATRNAIHDALGAGDGSGSPSQGDAVAFDTPRSPLIATGPFTLRSRDGTTVTLAPGDRLPDDLPYGYYALQHEVSGRNTRLVRSPGACALPPADLRTWGWAVQLYAARSRRSWGIGDLTDLRSIVDWSVAHGSKMVLVNPMHAAAPVLSQQPSPYFPTSRVFRNPLYLDINRVPGASSCRDIVEPLGDHARSLNAVRRIDRDEVFRVKYAALNALWSNWNAATDGLGSARARFAAYQTAQGELLRDFATFCAYNEQRTSSWFDWPADMRRPDATGVTRFRDQHIDRVRFHSWVQWLCEEQLVEAGRGTALMTDLAIGVDRGGADAWLWQDSFALGMSVGAPPDEFNTQGQDWGLPPFDPWRLREAAYEPFIQTVRAAFRGAGALRMDHVMGLFRLYWIPVDASPKEGCYVYTPFSELLAILALESILAEAYVVGEDLGTVEDYVRDELAQANVLSYRLSQFEPGPTSAFPIRALSAVTTHDLPTMAGLWTGSDLAAQRTIGTSPNEEGTQEVRARLATRAEIAAPSIGESGDHSQITQFVEGAYRDLAQAPSMILNATLDDAIGVEERPNMPGTVDEWPNWRIALPLPLEDVLDDPRTHRLADILTRNVGLGSI